MIVQVLWAMPHDEYAATEEFEPVEVEQDKDLPPEIDYLEIIRSFG